MDAKVKALQFSAIGWAMAEFHKGARRAAALQRRNAARARQETRQAARAAKGLARAAAF